MENARPEGQALDEILRLSLAGDAAVTCEREPEERVVSGHDFDWWDDRGDVIVREQSAIAPYTNVSGEIILRQQNHYRGPYDDDIILIVSENRPAVIAALKRLSADG